MPAYVSLNRRLGAGSIVHGGFEFVCNELLDFDQLNSMMVDFPFSIFPALSCKRKQSRSFSVVH